MKVSKGRNSHCNYYGLARRTYRTKLDQDWSSLGWLELTVTDSRFSLRFFKLWFDWRPITTGLVQKRSYIFNISCFSSLCRFQLVFRRVPSELFIDLSKTLCISPDQGIIIEFRNSVSCSGHTLLHTPLNTWNELHTVGHREHTVTVFEVCRLPHVYAWI